MTNPIVYRITNKLNGKCYIGQTVRPLKLRIYHHLYRKESLVSKAILKYGMENFDIEILEVLGDKAELDECEKFWIAEMGCIAPKGYNLTAGGEGVHGYKAPDTTRALQSELKKELYKDKSKHPRAGKPHTEETKRTIADKKKGTTSPRKGHKMTPEERKKASESKMGMGRVPVINLDTGEVFDSVGLAAEKYGVMASNITKVCTGKYKKSAGCRWAHYGGAK